MKIYKNKSGEFIVRFPSVKEKLRLHQEHIETFRREHDKRRGWFDRFSDEITEVSGSMGFLIFHVIFFTVWIAINVNLIPGIAPFDPFPFGFLTMIVSLDAIFLSIFVLLSQNSQTKIDELREETAYQVNMISEKEITKLIQMQAIIMKRLGIKIEGDAELEQMMENVDTRMIKKQLQKQVENRPKGILSVKPQDQVNKVLTKLTNMIDML